MVEDMGKAGMERERVKGMYAWSKRALCVRVPEHTTRKMCKFASRSVRKPYVTSMVNLVTSYLKCSILH